MKLMISCLNTSFNLFWSLSFLLFFAGCDFSEPPIGKEWKGTEEEFLETFRGVETDELNQSFLLADKFTGKPYTGEIVRNNEGRETNQKFSEGLLHGESVKKSDDGSWVEANYVNGKLHGSIKFYNADGTLRSEITYQNGKLDNRLTN